MITKRIYRKVRSLIQDTFTFPLRIKTLNASTPLDIKTYDGGNQCLHPSCLYFSEGWNGYKFWFVITPYKEMNEAIENPCIYGSNDGVNFTPCPNANPLDDIILPSECEYNSDPELVYNPNLNRIECWWRRVQTSKYPTESERNIEILYRSFTTDGINWSAKECMLKYTNSIDATRGLISPSIMYDNGTYDLWASSSRNENSTDRLLIHYSYKEGEEVKQVAEYKPKHSLSHICTLKESDKTIIVGFDVNQKGFPYMLYEIGKDNQLLCKGTILRQGFKNSWDGSRLYRPHIVKVESEYWLYYSAYQEKPSGNCHVGLLRFKNWIELSKCFLQ